MSEDLRASTGGFAAGSKIGKYTLEEQFRSVYASIWHKLVTSFEPAS